MKKKIKCYLIFHEKYIHLVPVHGFKLWRFPPCSARHSMLGAALVVCGYYMVFWGESKDTITETPVQPKSYQEPELAAIAIK